MLDYYFCEECETYHQPNRYINGEILSACQCEISTEPSIDLTPSRNQLSAKHYKHSLDNPVIVNPEQQSNIRYISPRVIRTAPQTAQISNQGKRLQNMPFISIMNQENRNKMRKIVVSPNRIQKTTPTFLSPRSVRQQVPILKSIHPVSSHSLNNAVRLQVTEKPRLMQPQLYIRKQEVPLKQKVVTTPIQTISKIAFPKVVQYPARPLMAPEYMAPMTQTYQSAAKDETLPQELFEKLEAEIAKKVELQRVSGNFRSEYDNDAFGFSNNRIQLDRATAENQIVFEKQEKGNCCPCYH